MKREEIIRAWIAEEGAPDALRATEDFEALEKITAALADQKAPPYPVEAELARFHRQRPAAQHRRMLPPLWRVAAAVLVLVTLGWWLRQYISDPAMVDIRTADTRTLYLPDSSQVTLSGHSRLRYSARHWARQRQVMLEGEAYFQVQKGSQFEVQSPQGTVTVLGTRFSVFDRGSIREVQCYEGRVAVSGPAETILEAGQGLTFAGDTPQPLTTPLRQPDWLSGQRQVHSWPLSLVLDEIARVYEVSIHADAIDQRAPFTGTLLLRDLEATLKIIAGSTGTTYRIEENEVYFVAQ